jgi:hypothetical protein
MGKKNLRAYADRGYFNGPEIKACDDAGIQAFVPKPATSNAKAERRFDKADFIYIARDDEYQCPCRAARHLQVHEGRERAAAPTLLEQRVPGLPHEAAMHAERLQTHLTMTLRRGTIEHVFGTLKHWMGSTHFLTRGLERVGAEMNLHVLETPRLIRLIAASVELDEPVARRRLADRSHTASVGC